MLSLLFRPNHTEPNCFAQTLRIFLTRVLRLLLRFVVAYVPGVEAGARSTAARAVTHASNGEIQSIQYPNNFQREAQRLSNSSKLRHQ